MATLTVKSCPKCGVEGDIKTVFGYRKVPHPIPQSWCRVCRNKKPVAETPMYGNQLKAACTLAHLDKGHVTEIYIKEYPKDSNGTKRALKFMVTKLQKRGYFA